MDKMLRNEVAAACREHDWLMRTDALPKAYVQRDAAPGVLVFKERAEALVTADDDSERNADGWNQWIAVHLANERAEVIDIITRTVGQFASEYVHEKLAPLNREIASLKGENAELRGMLGSVLAKFDALRASTEAIQRERQDETRDLAVRNQVIAERSDRIAQLQQENSASRAALAGQQLNQAFGQRDARIDMIETKLGMLLKWIGGDLPRGFGRTDET